MAKKKHRADKSFIFRCRSDDLKAFRKAAQREGCRSVAGWMLKHLRPRARKQTRLTVLASNVKALKAIDEWASRQIADGETPDVKTLLGILKRGYVILEDLREALGEYPDRDDNLEQLYQGLCVLDAFWTENGE